MFQKLRTNPIARNDAAVVEFTGKVQRIARLHQMGLKDRPSQHSEDVPYPERKLLGFNDIEQKNVEFLIQEFLTSK
jgi:phage virion morphogenesis protein